MAVRKTTQLGDPRLKAKNKIIKNFTTKKLHQVVKDLIDTMYAEDLIGMAAPQIGENYQVFVTQPRKTEARPADQADILRIYINPKLVNLSTEQSIIYEGCGSVRENGMPFGPVERPKIVTVEAYDLTGKKFRFKADGILGRVILHECDHLAGIEFVDKVDPRKLISRETYLNDIKNSPAQKAASVITLKEFQSNF